MNEIKFFHNWNNKLDCNVFTTIRKCTDEKWHYYLSKKGDKFKIILDKSYYGERILKDLHVMKYRDIPQLVLQTDTGYYKRDLIDKLFKRFGCNYDTQVMILVFGV